MVQEVSEIGHLMLICGGRGTVEGAASGLATSCASQVSIVQTRVGSFLAVEKLLIRN